MNKPFDLQKALAGEPVVTRLGKKVSQLTKFTDLRESYYPLIGVTEEGEYLYCKENGRQSDNSDSNNDLFMAPEKKTVWVNIYSKPSLVGDCTVIQATQHPHDDQGTAKACRDNLISNGYSVHATVPIEIEL